MIKFHRLVGLAAALLLSTGVCADGIEVEGAWTRATIPGQKEAMVYLSVTSKQNATIVGVSSKAARTGEMHRMEHANGMMKMYQVKSIGLPANERMEMSQHGYHLVLSGLKAPLKEGESVPLILSIEIEGKRAVAVEAMAEVRALGGSAKPAAEDHHEHHH